MLSREIVLHEGDLVQHVNGMIGFVAYEEGKNLLIDCHTSNQQEITSEDLIGYMNNLHLAAIVDVVATTAKQFFDSDTTVSAADRSVQAAILLQMRLRFGSNGYAWRLGYVSVARAFHAICKKHHLQDHQKIMLCYLFFGRPADLTRFCLCCGQKSFLPADS